MTLSFPVEIKFKFLLQDLLLNHHNSRKLGSGGGRVVKLLVCEARGPGFDSWSRHLNFRDWLSPASKLRHA